MADGSRLHLLRHAKSSWDDASVHDHERPLAPRGRRTVALLRQHLDQTALAVDLVLCSSARRTQQTWAGVSAGVQTDPRVVIAAEVYAATASDLLGLVRTVDPAVRSLMIVGHNPGLEELADGLAGDGDTTARARLRDGFPTGALASLTVDSPWADLAWDSAYLDGFVRPSDLPRD
jgi:phosphohistidine phosphatase